jgi:hypothetical protein
MEDKKEMAQISVQLGQIRKTRVCDFTRSHGGDIVLITDTQHYLDPADSDTGVYPASSTYTRDTVNFHADSLAQIREFALEILAELDRVEGERVANVHVVPAPEPLGDSVAALDEDFF